MIWPFVLIYALIAGRFVWLRAEQDNIGRLLFFAVVCSLPTILSMVLVFSWGLALASGCAFYLSARGPGPTCLLGSWDITDWMGLGPVTQLGLIFVLPVWVLFFGTIYSVAMLWDRVESRKKKN